MKMEMNMVDLKRRNKLNGDSIAITSPSNEESSYPTAYISDIPEVKDLNLNSEVLMKGKVVGYTMRQEKDEKCCSVDIEIQGMKVVPSSSKKIEVKNDSQEFEEIMSKELDKEDEESDNEEMDKSDKE